jgi:molybdopterin converting factor subunit 1
MRVRVLAFATAAQALGGAERSVELPDGATAADLLQRLTATASDLAPLRSRLAIAVDGHLVRAEHRLADGCEVALLPPVSGG